MKPLTVDELKALEVDEWIWIKNEYIHESYYAQIIEKHEGYITTNSTYAWGHYHYDQYGTKWVAYKNKESAEAEIETGSTVDIYIKDLEAAKEYFKQESHYWFGEANRNYEDCHNAWTEKVRKETATEILHELLTDCVERRKNIKKNPYDNEYETKGAYFENELEIIALKNYAKRYGVEADSE